MSNLLYFYNIGIPKNKLEDKIVSFFTALLLVFRRNDVDVERNHIVGTIHNIAWVVCGKVVSKEIVLIWVWSLFIVNGSILWAWQKMEHLQKAMPKGMLLLLNDQ